MRALLVVLVVSACKFDPSEGGGPIDAPPIDAPVASEVRFTDVTMSMPSLRPGRYGVEVTTVLHNGLAEAITNVRPSLVFRQGSTNHDTVFRWRDIDARDARDGVAVTFNPDRVEAGADATFRFRVDVLANAVLPGMFQIDGTAEFDTSAGPFVAAMLQPAKEFVFDTLPQPIVVTTADDELNGNGEKSLREALDNASQRPGYDRITFAPSVFPPDRPRTILLDASRGALPAINQDLVIDGSNAGVVIAIEAAGWQGIQTYGLRISNATVLIHGIEFRDMGFQYPPLNSTPGTDNCDGGEQRGGAIIADSGTLILDGNRFSDTNVLERNCSAASVRLENGSGHRILNNHWTDQSMDAVGIFAPTIEVSDNIMDAGGSRNFDKADDGIDVEQLDNSDLWVTGNLFVDHESSGVFTRNGDSGVLHVVNNTFVRTRLHAVRRLGLSRRVEVHNNAYQDSVMVSIHGDGSATLLTISHESFSTGDPGCIACTAASIDGPSLRNEDLGFTDPTGLTIEHFTPTSGSPLIDRGRDLLDRNGRTPRRFNGSAPDRGAVER